MYIYIYIYDFCICDVKTSCLKRRENKYRKCSREYEGEVELRRDERGRAKRASCLHFKVSDYKVLYRKINSFLSTKRNLKNSSHPKNKRFLSAKG